MHMADSKEVVSLAEHVDLFHMNTFLFRVLRLSAQILVCGFVIRMYLSMQSTMLFELNCTNIC